MTPLINSKRMKINDYIAEQGLILIARRPTQQLFAPWFRADLFDHTGDGPFNRYEIYANEQRTIYVSVNLTKQRFRILYTEPVTRSSDWEPVKLECSGASFSPESSRGAWCAA
jgi:hypothetical protein